jgi:uncharacterized protein YgbK (DUF1537 family)
MRARRRVAELLAMPEWPDDPLPGIIELGADSMVIALDDDPTGTQTVRDTAVVTRWDAQRLAWVLAGTDPLVFLLTNSRSLTSADAERLGRSLGQDLRTAEMGATRRWAVVSRSDSTLRGHFPAEVDALADGLGRPEARLLLAPFFGDGGRITVDGTHHLRRDDELVPVAETEFARDPVFGYRSSELRAWVLERTTASGSARPRDTRSLTLDRVRGEGPAAVRDALLQLPARGVLAVDAASERDIEVVALGALLAERAGMDLVARTAASYVRARAGKAAIAPLGPGEITGGRPGLIVVGSHVPSTSAQLQRLLEEPPVPLATLDLDVGDLLATDADAEEHLITATAAEVDRALRGGRTPVITTSRTLVRGDDREEDTAIQARVAGALVAIVRAVMVRPAWVLAKGGITSSDMATDALGMAEARIVGPLLPGVPVWRSGPTARWPGMDLVVFPGNVGGPEAVRDAVSRMAGVA